MSASISPSTRSEPKKLGFWMCTALVVGNMIASGIFLLPASLAPYGHNSLIAWVLTATGAILLAIVFSRLSKAFPGGGGPYAYVHAAFGPLPAFVVSWGYWISIWVGNAAIGTGGVSYLTPFFPGLGANPRLAAAVTIGLLWLLTGVNWLGVRSAGWVQGVTTVMKVLPLLAIAGAGLFALDRHSLVLNSQIPFSLGAVASAATLTLWALLGLESATIPDSKVENPERTIPRATMIGTVLTALVYIVACTTVLVLLPTSQLATSNAPFADVARMLWGDKSAKLLALFAAISAFGALNGWILLQGEVPHTLAKDGVFPKVFAQTSRRDSPTFALVFTSVLVTILILMNASSGLVKVFTFMALLSTSTCLVMYLGCCLALLKLRARGQLETARKGTARLAVVGALGALYSLATIIGAGWDAALWGLALLVAGVPVYWLVRRGREQGSWGNHEPVP